MNDLIERAQRYAENSKPKKKKVTNLAGIIWVISSIFLIVAYVVYFISASNIVKSSKELSNMVAEIGSSEEVHAIQQQIQVSWWITDRYAILLIIVVVITLHGLAAWWWNSNRERVKDKLKEAVRR